MTTRIAVATMVALGLTSCAASAQDLVYSPVNPSFGGNPLNSSHLMSLAAAQRDATASDSTKKTATPISGGGSTSGGSTSTSDVDLFVRQLQGRLLSALASQVTDAIFGENPKDSGTVQFGDTKVEFERTADAITLRITAGDGTVTVISVPQLLTSAGPTTPLSAAASTLNASSLTGSSTSSSLTSGSLSSSSLF